MARAAIILLAVDSDIVLIILKNQSKHKTSGEFTDDLDAVCLLLLFLHGIVGFVDVVGNQAPSKAGDHK